MSEFYVSVPVWAFVGAKVDAANEEEAREKAEKLIGTPRLCHQCSREIEINDLDWDNVEVWKTDE